MKKHNANLLVVFAVLIVLGCIYHFSSDNLKTNTTNNTVSSVDNNKFLAYNYAIKFVKKELKSPSSAVFPTGNEKYDSVTDLGGGEYEINSWVESQNSFGAQIKTDFSCKIIIKDDVVRCEDLHFK